MAGTSQARIFFKPKHSLGQNFLFDEKILRAIATSCLAEQNSTLIEIGPGYGSLTRLLTKKDTHAVFAIEKDERLFNWLQTNLVNESVDLTKADALEIDWPSFLASKQLTANTNLVIVGNLPYNIANQLVSKLLTPPCFFKRMVFLVQKEVGQRWVANPNRYKSKYSNLSIFINYFCQTKLLLEVPKQAFKPVPEVDGVLVELEIKQASPVDFQEAKFLTFVRNCFRFRRKTLYNNIKSFSLDQAKTQTILEKLGYQAKVRPQDLSLEAYKALFSELTSSDKDSQLTELYA